MRALISVVALALALTACSSDEPEVADPSTEPSNAPSSTSSEPEPEPPTSEPEPEPEPEPDLTALEVVEAWVSAYAESDGPAACALQTDEYTEADLAAAVEDDVIEEGTSCEDGVVAGAALGEAFGLDLSAGEATEVSNDGSTAVVKVTYPEFGASKYEVVLTDDGWLISKEL